MESGLLHTLMARYEAEGVAPDGDIHRGEYNPKCWSKQKGWHQVATSIVESITPSVGPESARYEFVLKCRRLSRGGIKVLNCFAKNLFGRCAAV